MQEQIIIEKSEVEALYSLRQSVLRPGRPLESCYFDGDHEQGTQHIVAKLDDEIVGCATLCQRHFPLERQGHRLGYQIRGMAVSPSCQGRGIGKLLLDACLHEVSQIEYCWCNARVKAANLYLSKGFVMIGEEFVIEDVGPHFLMIKEMGCKESGAVFCTRSIL